MEEEKQSRRRALAIQGLPNWGGGTGGTDGGGLTDGNGDNYGDGTYEDPAGELSSIKFAFAFPGLLLLSRISYFLSSGWLDCFTFPIDTTPTAAALRWAMDPYTIGLAQADSERSTHVELDFEGGSGGAGGGGSGGGQVLDPDLRRLDARMRQTSLLNEALARKNSYLASVLAQVS